jgi:hypothetical protein
VVAQTLQLILDEEGHHLGQAYGFFLGIGSWSGSESSHIVTGSLPDVLRGLQSHSHELFDFLPGIRCLYSSYERCLPCVDICVAGETRNIDKTFYGGDCLLVIG